MSDNEWADDDDEIKGWSWWCWMKLCDDDGDNKDDGHSDKKERDKEREFIVRYLKSN